MRVRSRFALPLLAAALSVGVAPALVATPVAHAAPADDTPTLLNVKGEHETGDDEASFDKLRDAYYWSRLLSGDDQLTEQQAAVLREKASQQAGGISSETVSGTPRGGTWQAQGPNPIVQNGRTTNRFQAVSGRIGALAIRNNGTVILGAAQGGIWTYDAASQTWTSRTKDADTQAVGALAIAPSNDAIVYMGSGEGALSGDSYYGDGIWKSTDGGVTWTHVSSLFTGQATSALAVDPTNPNHVYATTLRGRGGNHRTTAPTDPAYGIWESTDGGANWTLRMGTHDQLHGATDIVMDPQNPKNLWASFWGDAIYKSTDGGATWTKSMGNLPEGNFLEGGTRFALGISHPAGVANPTLYTGFDWFDTRDAYHSSRVFKSVDGGTTWADATGSPQSGPDSVVAYCGTQCFYDNVVKPDPNNPDVVYALGVYGYNNSPQSGGIYRSVDGGAHWLSLGYDLHPDFHAIAFQPTDTKHVAIGNDGGVWQSHNEGGRLAAGAPLSAADWENLNGTVNPSTAALVHATGLQITQFTSAATVPLVPGQYWGGTQDNGTLRKSLANNRWFDQASGDGGQVIVDQTTPNTLNPTVPAWVFGTYFGISPYRYDPAHTNTFFGNEAIDGGINLNDRAEFYVPWVQNRGNVNQMFLGTYRLYRTNNAEAPSAGDVTWDPISGDLSTGCTGAAPNGARGCFISAIGVADGGDGVYVGTDDAVVSVSPNAVTSDHPTWTRVGQNVFPNRPVNQFAVDRSNWRIAYVAFGGFGAATPGNSGHVFATTDGGQTWQNVTGNLPDVPVNSVVMDPTSTSTIYVGTDVGTFVSTNGGKVYKRLGDGIPKVASWQLDYDATNGVLLNGTHGRGAYTLQNRTASAALVVSKSDSGTPVGPGSQIDYTLTVKNIGNATATGVYIADKVPSQTTFVSADQGGYLGGPNVRWDNTTIPAGGQLDLHFSVKISASLPSGTTSIVNDGITVKADGGISVTGSPHATPIAPPFGVTVEPTEQAGGAKVGTSVSYNVDVTNEGFKADSYAVSPSGGYATSTYDATCTTPLTTTPQVAAGDSTSVCVKVAVPANAANDATNSQHVTATSVGSPNVSASAAFTTIAVASDNLLVDGDTNDPVDSAPFYKNAMGSRTYGYWDLAAKPALPLSYLKAHTNVVWWTGNAYPGPISPYESELASFLDGGGRLLMSGQDILDQAAGTTAFVKNYLHINWDGTEVQNDKATASVTAVAGNPVTTGIGTVAIDHNVLKAAFEDRITPIAPGTAAFRDASGATNALTVASGAYKVFFAAFPVESYGTAADKATLVGNTLSWFATP
ncbi:MAG TPA: hypothetical protein VFR40_12505 [Lapillicoccus sp.]|nr:hypothetical protein [Lapillicoccus sp.]